MSARHRSYRKLEKLLHRKWDDTADNGIGDWTEQPTENEVDRLEQFLGDHNFEEGRGK